ncbi:MAG: hypothetical protein CVU16_08360 [Betaproteobacteria bacterium HGW-Betaproteobacteria-10]|jgi:hypothetical protein|nr:MAG: hypothetical protein CVU16_08360 [Betaproteobacteria bacterium HGW-Betaproteobacteria-10]
MNTRHSLILIVALALFGCDQINQKLGLEDPAKKEARTEAEGKAVGSACRQSGRAIEDCYSIYSWLPKAGVFEGWREMDAYMRENKIETIVPQLPPPEAPGNKKKKKIAADETSDAVESKESAAEPPSAPEKKTTKH